MNCYGRSSQQMRRTVIIQRIIILVLCIAIVSVSIIFLKQTRLNRFSKNIIFSDNYFLRNFANVYTSYIPSNSDSKYTISEAEAITLELVKESGIPFVLENSFIFTVYRPARELDKIDILAYYYNYLSSVYVSNGEPYFLFSSEIYKQLSDEGIGKESLFSQSLATSHINDLIDLSFEWSPLDSLYVRQNGTIYSDFAVVVEEDSYEDYVKRNDELKNRMREAALKAFEADKNDYTYEEVCALYFNSVAEKLPKEIEYLPAHRVLELLDEYEKQSIRPRILDAENILQLPEYPNGCEAVSAVMLLKYFGYDVEKSDFIENHLEKGKVKIRFGIRFGPDPKEKYAGDPSSKRGGWGCFAPAIVKALDSYLDAENNSSHKALNVSGAELSVLCETFIDCSIPVAIWITQDYSAVSEVYQWLDHEDKQVYLYPANQHCVMLMGYDKDNYYVCDPLKDEKYIAISRSDAELSYTSMGSQAVVLMPIAE